MVDVESIRQDVFTALRTILVANVPTYTYASTEFTYSVIAEYSRQAADFPYILLNPALVKVELLNADGSGEEYSIIVQLDLYALELHRRQAIDVGIDSIRKTIIDNQSVLKDTYDLLLDQDPFDESETAPFEDNTQALNTGSIMLRMKLA